MDNSITYFFISHSRNNDFVLLFLLFSCSRIITSFQKTSKKPVQIVSFIFEEIHNNNDNHIINYN